MSETRTQVIGLCRAEAHANLQRHIRDRYADGPVQIARRYTAHTQPRRGGSTGGRPLSPIHLMALAAAVALLRLGRAP